MSSLSRIEQEIRRRGIELKLDLGCGDRKPPGYIGIDKKPGPGVDIVWDLERGIPFPDNKFDVVRAWHFLEHMPDPIFIMDEAWRVLKPSGVLELEVPATPGDGAFANPTHKSYWNRLSFQFYSDDTLRQSCGVRAKFSIEELEERDDPEWRCRYVRARLRAVKPRANEAIRPFSRFIPPKPAMAFYTEFFSAEEAWEKWAKDRIADGIQVEPKFNGFRAIVEKAGSRARMWIEDSPGKNILPKFPDVEKAVKSIADDFILDCDLGIEENGHRLPRIRLMTLTADKPELAPGQRVVVTAFDLPYWNGPLDETPLSERRAKLESFFGKRLKPSPNFRLSPKRVARDKASFLAASKWAASQEMSEGMVAKTLSSPYALSGATSEWAKVKHVVEVKAIVLGKQANKNGTWSYRCGLLLGDADYANTVEVDGQKYVDLGKTFATKIKADVGDIVTVEVEEIIEKENSLHWLGPKVVDVDKARRQPYFAKQVIDLAKRGRVYQRAAEALGDEGETRGERAAKWWAEHWHEVFPASGRGRFVYQHHYRHLPKKEQKLGEDELLGLPRGVSVHGDLRLEGDDALWGVSVFLGKAEDVRKAGGCRLCSLPPDDNLQIAFKLPQPKGWLDVGKRKPMMWDPGDAVEGKLDKFFAVDWGTYDMGVAREHMIEIFLRGNKLKGRYLLEYAPIGGRRVWIIDRPRDQTPYAESHKLEDVVRELRRKGQKWLIWAKPGARPRKIDVTKFKAESVREVIWRWASQTLS